MREHFKSDAEIHNKLVIGRYNVMKLENERLKEEIARLKAHCTCQKM